MIIRDLVVILVQVITLIIGIVLYVKKVSDIRWYQIYLIPVVCSIIHFILTNRNPLMYPVYFTAILGLLLIFMHKMTVLPIAISVVSILLAVFPMVYSISAKLNCYASLGYVDAFKSFHDEMKEHYALQDWKETDFDAKYEEYVGLFEEAEQKHDKEEYVEALLSYLASYQDGHVQMCDMYEYIGIGSTRNIQNTYASIYNNYYGMILIQLDTGEYDVMAERWTGRRLTAAEAENISGITDIRYESGTYMWHGGAHHIGCENLSADIVRTVADIEEVMRK